MKKLLGTVCLMLVLAPAAMAVEGWCGFIEVEVTEGCSGGTWYRCESRFITLATGHGSGWTCVYEVNCTNQGSCALHAGQPLPEELEPYILPTYEDACNDDRDDDRDNPA